MKLFGVLVLMVLIGCRFNEAPVKTEHDGAAWEEVYFQEGNCFVSFPGYVVEQSQTSWPGVNGGSIVYANSVVVKDSLHANMAYRVDVTRFLGDSITDSVNIIFDQQQKELIARTTDQNTKKVSLIKSESADFNGYPGRIISLKVQTVKDVEKFMHADYRMFWANNRLYKLIVFTADDRLGNPEIKRFFDSYRHKD